MHCKIYRTFRKGEPPCRRLQNLLRFPAPDPTCPPRTNGPSNELEGSPEAQKSAPERPQAVVSVSLNMVARRKIDPYLLGIYP
jgi:hypothetical protein